MEYVIAIIAVLAAGFGIYKFATRNTGGGSGGGSGSGSRGGDQDQDIF